MANRYMRKPYRCNICLRTFNTVRQAEKHWVEAHEITPEEAVERP